MKTRSAKKVWQICLWAVFLPAVFFSFSNAQTAGNTEKDNQIWNETQLVVWSNDRHELSVSGGLRLGRNLSYLTDRSVSVLYSYKPSAYLTLAGGYLYRAVLPFANRKTFENRLSGSLTFNVPLPGKFKLANRHIFEYRAVNSRSDLRVYRNRLRLEREVSFGKTKITPFGSVEVFYSQRDHWYRSRYAFGVGKKLTKHVSGEIFYQRQNDAVTRPGDLNVIGTSVRIKL